MKAILMSFQPQWCAKILNREKTIEIRKRFPLDYVGWVYVYCTKKGETIWGKGTTFIEQVGEQHITGINYDMLNGKVIARFWCDSISKFDYNETIKDYAYANRQMKLMTEFLENTQVPYDEIIAYGKGKPLYAIHITKLEIFDTPKELKEFNVWRKKTIYSGMDCPPYVDDIKAPLTRAPHNWCWVEVEE